MCLKITDLKLQPHPPDAYNLSVPCLLNSLCEGILWIYLCNNVSKKQHWTNFMFGVSVFRLIFSTTVECNHHKLISPSAAYMRQWIGSALVQVMVVAYSTPSHYLNQYWVIVNWTLRNKLQWLSNQNIKLFIHENASQNIVCEIAAILSRGIWAEMGMTSRL